MTSRFISTYATPCKGDWVVGYLMRPNYILVIASRSLIHSKHQVFNDPSVDDILMEVKSIKEDYVNES